MDWENLRNDESGIVYARDVDHPVVAAAQAAASFQHIESWAVTLTLIHPGEPRKRSRVGRELLPFFKPPRWRDDAEAILELVMDAFDRREEDIIDQYFGESAGLLDPAGWHRIDSVRGTTYSRRYGDWTITGYVGVAYFHHDFWESWLTAELESAGQASRVDILGTAPGRARAYHRARARLLAAIQRFDGDPAAFLPPD